MKNKTVIIASVVGIIFLLIVIYLVMNDGKSNDGPQKEGNEYYLTSGWETERVGQFYISLPEDWEEDEMAIDKWAAAYKATSNELRMFKMELKDFDLICMYVDAKDGHYQNWNLRKAANSMINQVLYNMKCKNIALQRTPPYNNRLEVNYSGITSCSTYNYKALLRGIRTNSHILMICAYYKESDTVSDRIAEKILTGIENKYPEASNPKN